MPTPVFNTIANILERDFKVPPAQIHRETTLVEIGLDSLALMEFVFAVEDAFHLRIPEDLLDPREAGITLERLCQVVEEMLDVPAALPMAGLQA